MCMESPQSSPGLAICIPTYRDDASRLIRALSMMPEAEDCALLLFDDGSSDADLVARHEAALAEYPGPKIHHVGAENRGRSFSRNWLVTNAPSDWILFIDADMLPDSRAFLQRYLKTIKHADGRSLIAGGFSLLQVSPCTHTRLHWYQSRVSECVAAEIRKSDPGRYVFSSNILVHRDVLSAVSFDEGYSGWGWEDVDWGLRVAKVFPIIHIDNSATHLGLETDVCLLNKYGASGPNFARLVNRHPDAAARMPLLKAARHARRIPLLAPVARVVAASRFLPDSVRGLALKLYRAAAYAPFLKTTP